ncbi:MAG: NUDIX hydrolase, partial [Syntrophomonadaceae bacterium]|nr:NUDIX hydrolase [Syntrophomonadaceae bacterium]
PLDRVLTEIPAGSLYEGEDPLACAQRELEEETGFKARHWEKILSYYSAPGFTDEQLHIYLAGGLFPGQTNPDPDEFIETELVPLDKAYRMIFSGEIVDGKSIIAIQYLASRRLQPLPEV